MREEVEVEVEVEEDGVLRPFIGVTSFFSHLCTRTEVVGVGICGSRMRSFPGTRY